MAPASDNDVAERLRSGNYDNDTLVSWCNQRLHGTLSLTHSDSEALDKALSTNLPSRHVELSSIHYRALACYPDRLERVLRLRSQDVLPIVLARPDGGKMWVLDGRHRCEAAAHRGNKHIRAVIVDVDGRFYWRW